MVRHLSSLVVGSLIVTAVVGGLAGCPSEVAAPGCQGEGCKPVEEDTEPPRIFVDPPFGLGFDCVTIGCDTERRMVVENRGGGTISLVLARLAVDSSADFTLRTGTGDALPFDEASAIAITPTTPLELFVRYVPRDGTADQGTVTLDWHDAKVAFEDAVLETVELPLSTRALGDVAATPQATRLNFGFVPVGGSASRSVVIDNTGAGGVLGVGPVTSRTAPPPSSSSPPPAPGPSSSRTRARAPRSSSTSAPTPSAPSPARSSCAAPTAPSRPCASRWPAPRWPNPTPSPRRGRWTSAPSA
jgi:hypothetical protein